ncbi:DNA internalization-related competence protein ComEC/Rec2 [Candidatus Latescibacterota bacterium]
MNTVNNIHTKKPLAGPAMKAAVAFAVGILACVYIPVNLPYILVISVIGIVFLIRFYNNNFAGDICALAVIFSTGMAAYSIHHDINRPLTVPYSFTNRTVRIEGTVTGTSTLYSGNSRFNLRCYTILADSTVHNVSGILPCIIYNKTVSIPEGSHVLIQGKLKRQLLPLTLPREDHASPYPRFTHRLVIDSSAPNPRIIEPGTVFFGSIRKRLSDMIDRYHFGGHGNLLKAMILGERNALTFETRAQFAQSGIAHILAVSGLHVGILALALNFILAAFKFPKKIRILIIVCFMGMYAGICGFRPPVTRAVIMISMVFGAMLFERPRNVENSLFVALIVILAFDPVSLFSPSLQLSFAAVWGITTFYSPIIQVIKPKHRLLKPIQYILSIFVVSTLAFIVTSPVVAGHFGSLPLLSVPVNIIAVPLTFFIVILGITTIVLIPFGSIVSPITSSISLITGILLRVLSWLAGSVSQLKYASLTTGNVSALAGLSLTVCLYILSRSAGRNTLKKAVVYIPLLLLLISTWQPVVATGKPGEKEGSVYFFDVGQGDAALIGYGETRYFLVDTGPEYGSFDAGASLIVPSLKNLGISHLDGIFLSHTDSDHSGGLDSVVETIRVDHIFCRDSVADSLKVLYGDSVVGISAGDSIAFDEGGILILYPVASSNFFYRKHLNNDNNLSLLVRFEINGSRVLFTGDVEWEAQRFVTQWGTAIESVILKVPHHGARGLDDKFIGTIKPRLAIISCGAGNRYGHPAESTISALEHQGCTIWRTDRDGTVRVMLPALNVSSY